MSAARQVWAMLALAACVAWPVASHAQRPPNEDYQPPVKGEAVFDPRPEKRAAAAAEAARKEAEAAAAVQAVQVPIESEKPAPEAAAEIPEAPVPTPVPASPSQSEPTPASPPEEAPRPIRTPIENPRPFGYLVGDTLIQKIQLTVEGVPVELAELPRKDRFGTWISRRSSSIERRADGTRWLVLDYQIINASKDVDVIALPKLSLRTTTPDVFIEVPDWPISVGAITGPIVRNQGGLVGLQPDRPAPTIATAPIRRALHLSLIGLALTLALWLGWWRYREWQAAERLPFARAARELKFIEADSEDAWRLLHQAFDATAGRVIQPASLPALFRAAPQLEAAREQIERFYAASAERFFGGKPAALPLAALCAELRQIEKTHER